MIHREVPVNTWLTDMARQFEQILNTEYNPTRQHHFASPHGMLLSIRFSLHAQLDLSLYATPNSHLPSTRDSSACLKHF